MNSAIPTLITQADPVELIATTTAQLNRVILGKEHQLRLCIACLLARGHLLIEDIPGVGKTTLAHALAESLGLSYQRIQFTSDLLPADIIGVSVFDRDTSTFQFHKGPVFSQLVLADEVNRATPKAQSALLEAMEEHQVTADGQTYPMAAPFFVIATQNPVYQIGTYPLPESQLDRFLMRIELGYPDAALERQLLLGQDRRDLLATLAPTLTPQQLLLMQSWIRRY
jgi:MoxR-like ATPase